MATGEAESGEGCEESRASLTLWSSFFASTGRGRHVDSSDFQPR